MERGGGRREREREEGHQEEGWEGKVRKIGEGGKEETAPHTRVASWGWNPDNNQYSWTTCPQNKYPSQKGNPKGVPRGVQSSNLEKINFSSVGTFLLLLPPPSSPFSSPLFSFIPSESIPIKLLVLDPCHKR
jgi:hypothetical protein